MFSLHTHDGFAHIIGHYRGIRIIRQESPPQELDSDIVDVGIPPILIGAGGRRMLSIAAREADIVSVAINTTATGTLDFATGTAQAYGQREESVQWTAMVRTK